MKEDTFEVRYFNWDDGLYLFCRKCNCVTNVGMTPSPFYVVNLAIEHVHPTVNAKSSRVRTLSENMWKGIR